MEKLKMSKIQKTFQMIVDKVSKITPLRNIDNGLFYANKDGQVERGWR